ncbi:hypothetical protein ACTFIU_009080 [Dictyostelium citrinum]
MDANQKENNKLNDEKEDSNDFNVPDNKEQQDFKIPFIPKKAEDKQYLKSMISTVFESDKDDNEKANELMNQLLKSTNSNENDTLYNENDDTNKKRKFFNKINVNQKNKNNDDNNNSNDNNNNNNKNDDDNDHGNPVKKKINSLKYDENDELDSILLEKKKESEIVNKNKKKEKFKF